MLAGVSIILTNERQLASFEDLLKARPEVIPYIRSLWTICPGSVRRVHKTCVNIINTCIHLRALACHPHVLLESISRGPDFKHTRCVDLTMIEFRVTWNSFMQSPNGAKLFNQLQRLHFIGALDNSAWANWAVIPKLDNLSRASIAMGSHKQIQPSLFAQLIKSPKLQQVVITTRLHGEDQQMLSNAVQDIDDRFGVIHRRRRWKESNLWHESLQDPNRFWNQAKEEKYLPPPPRPNAK
ncbi:hypothetical protein MSAN_01837500 [Mycena sanguinolenta]|uniref:Uncharacterized protein n=1 Tax=Mycena sanguinolenta TaxID=230812 RepID=A0A8H7CSR6_9AGAR|nr:hypothetical protein MSAN_01837500 [Mycena sanguinolenta]